MFIQEQDIRRLFCNGLRITFSKEVLDYDEETIAELKKKVEESLRNSKEGMKYDRK